MLVPNSNKTSIFCMFTALPILGLKIFKIFYKSFKLLTELWLEDTYMMKEHVDGEKDVPLSMNKTYRMFWYDDNTLFYGRLHGFTKKSRLPIIGKSFIKDPIHNGEIIYKRNFSILRNGEVLRKLYLQFIYD